MMKYRVHVMFFAGLITTNLVHACLNLPEKIELTGSEVFIPQRLGNIQLCYDDNGFYIIKNNVRYDIPSDCCNDGLGKISKYQVMRFLGREKPRAQIIMLTPEEFSNIINNINPDAIIELSDSEKEDLLGHLVIASENGGYISVNQTNKGDYILHANDRGRGGGFWKILGGIVLGTAAGVGVVVGGAALIASLPASGATAMGWTLIHAGQYLMIQNGLTGAATIVLVTSDAAIAMPIIGATGGAALTGAFATERDTQPPVTNNENATTVSQETTTTNPPTNNHDTETTQDDGFEQAIIA